MAIYKKWDPSFVKRTNGNTESEKVQPDFNYLKWQNSQRKMVTFGKEFDIAKE